MPTVRPLHFELGCPIRLMVGLQTVHIKMHWSLKLSVSKHDSHGTLNDKTVLMHECLLIDGKLGTKSKQCYISWPGLSRAMWLICRENINERSKHSDLLKINFILFSRTLKINPVMPGGTQPGRGTPRTSQYVGANFSMVSTCLVL